MVFLEYFAKKQLKNVKFGYFLIKLIEKNMRIKYYYYFCAVIDIINVDRYEV
jgi:hypothetical protein